MIAFSSGTYSIILRDPDFQDTRSVLTGVKVKTMMDGSVRSRRWSPAPMRFSLTFNELTRDKAIELEAYLVNTAGQQTHYIDPSGRSWPGRIITEPFEITTPSRGFGPSGKRQEANRIQIEFEVYG